MSNFKTSYYEKHQAAIQKELGLGNIMQVPRMTKITVNVGLGEALQNSKLIESGIDQLRVITGQQPVVTKAKKSISNFKLREGVSIGL
ncbi:MAG: 50S ribosomal protein L5, partial [Nitrospinae bacterium]|nr:50S ribosomal protein L5 [Nitrospinota bacterium]